MQRTALEGFACKSPCQRSPAALRAGRSRLLCRPQAPWRVGEQEKLPGLQMGERQGGTSSTSSPSCSGEPGSSSSLGPGGTWGSAPALPGSRGASEAGGDAARARRYLLVGDEHLAALLVLSGFNPLVQLHHGEVHDARALLRAQHGVGFPRSRRPVSKHWEGKGQTLEAVIPRSRATFLQQPLQQGWGHSLPSERPGRAVQ